MIGMAGINFGSACLKHKLLSLQVLNTSNFAIQGHSLKGLSLEPLYYESKPDTNLFLRMSYD